MIQLSPGHTILFMALTIIGCLSIIRIAYNIMMYHIRIIKSIHANNKEFKRRMKNKNDMQAKGDGHEWINIPYGTEEVMVCKKTGWSPTLNAFLSMEYVNMWLKRQEREKEYQAYREEKMILLAEKHGINKEKMEEIAEGIFAIKQSFHVKKMKQAVKEMRSGEKNI